ncbi:MAG: metallophosphoesterase [Acidimicrobiia bacterium]|nr:metallophosphoesterase [Acidimicrobiia bacterium]
MTFHVVADVHGAHEALARVAPEGSTVLVLGDLVNLVDYRTNEGIVPDVVGVEMVKELVALRAAGLFDKASELWTQLMAQRGGEIRAAISARMQAEYADVARALARYKAYVTFGNVDQISMLKDSLPSTATFIDTGVVEIDGHTVGFAGGGVPLIGSQGEVSEEEMAKKLATLGPVDILCTHVPPAVDVLSYDVVGGRPKASQPILDYIKEYRPAMHFFGDVHQPTALTWRVGTTVCRNVGYFRATGRSVTYP